MPHSSPTLTCAGGEKNVHIGNDVQQKPVALEEQISGILPSEDIAQMGMKLAMK